ncbi:MAG: GNAT family N-acetyltransferase [Pseudoxanthomonas sp.]
MSLEIRSAHAADAAELARLSGQLGYPANAAAMSERLAAVLADDAQAVFVAARGGALLGWIEVEDRVSLEAGKQAEIIAFVVDAQARRAGVGRELLAAAESWARDRGFDALTVRSNVLRIESHPFYEKHGFVRRKTQHAYWKRLQIRE